MNFHFVFVH